VLDKKVFIAFEAMWPLDMVVVRKLAALMEVVTPNRTFYS
jgi:hypothetical protein